MPNPTNDPISDVSPTIQETKRVSENNSPDTIEMLYIESPAITLQEFRQAISNLLIAREAEEVEMAADFAEDVLDQFSYNGKSGGLSTLEWAEGIIKRHKKLQQQLKDKEKL